MECGPLRAALAAHARWDIQKHRAKELNPARLALEACPHPVRAIRAVPVG